MGEKILEKSIWRGVGESHITILEPKEMKKPILKKIKEHHIAELMKTPQDFTCLGIGRHTKDGESVYFLVIDWPWANQLRKEILGFDTPKQFHITLCWTGKSDIHGVDKGPSSLEW